MEGSNDLAQLLYRSRATQPMSAADLRALLQQARARNGRERLTGFLVYDRGRFVQWLEGPADGLARVWASIRADARHRDIERLVVPPLVYRLFSDWTMQIGHDGTLDGAGVPLPRAALLDLRERRVPEGEAMHGVAFWHGLPPAEDLAKVLARGGDAQLAALTAGAVRLQPSLHELGVHLFLPVCQALGDGWQSDGFDRTDILIAQGRLAVLLHAAAESVPLPEAMPTHGAALVAGAPAVHAVAGVALAGIALQAAGFAVDCEFPPSESALLAALQSHPYALLHLQDDDLLADDRLLAQRAALIRAARRRALNPRLLVLLGGRLFAERPELATLIGADGELLVQGLARRHLNNMMDFAAKCPDSAAMMTAAATLLAVTLRVQRRRFGGIEEDAGALLV